MLKQPALSPLLRQYFDIKEKYPDTLLLFQVGDFYELFFEDAQKAATLLGIMLTTRGLDHNGDPIPLCGVPRHVLSNYLTKLVKAGFKVAICDQIDEPKSGKIFSRTVTQVLTPGTLTDSQLLDDKSASYLAVLFFEPDIWTLIFIELLTGQIFVTTFDLKTVFDSYTILEAELTKFMPDEIILPKIKLAEPFISWLQKRGYNVTLEPFVNTEESEITEWLETQLGNKYKNLLETSCSSSALKLVYGFFKRNNERALGQLKQLFIYKPDDFLILDSSTISNLELVRNSHDNTGTNSLFSNLDLASTSMGSRNLKKWLLRPLTKIESINQRLDAVQFFYNNPVLCNQLRNLLKGVKDLERIIGRVSLRRASIQDYLALLSVLELVPKLALLGTHYPEDNLLYLIQAKIGNFDHLVNLLTESLKKDNSQEWLIKTGYNLELDRLRKLLDSGAQEILELEKQEQERTKIYSLKIRFNGSHGYGIEITKPNLHLVPTDYTRTQSLVNKDRFTCNALKELEYDLNRSKTDIIEIEKELFNNIKAEIEIHLAPLKKLAQAISYLDSLSTLAHLAYTRNYVRPIFNTKREINILNGRHPIIETLLPSTFITNNTELSNDQTLWIITGPNMGGKSTYLRQVALISILAQIGSFVPADSADLFILDRIFTRIGASDNSSRGKSTFLVEMEETALICNQATSNSLVILDEVGRGTSTTDGLAIAQAVIEYIYEHINARCLFATHYHELAFLADKFQGIKLYYAASTKTADGIVLLHKILPGVADGSFGLEVARLVNLPQALLERAAIILEQLTQNKHMGPLDLKNKKQTLLNNNYYTDKLTDLMQKNKELEILLEQKIKSSGYEHKIAEEISQLDCDSVTAKQALDILWRLKDYTQ